MSSDFLAVFHMAGGFADATATKPALAGSTSGVAYSAGPIADAMAIPQGAFARIPPGTSVNAIVTMSGLLRVDVEHGSRFTALVTAPIAGVDADLDRLYLGWHAGRPFAETTNDSGMNCQVEGDSGVLQRWTHLGLVVDGGIASLYVDGMHPVKSSACPGETVRELGLFIGADCDKCQPDAQAPNIDYLTGAIDELRFERVLRSDTWMNAQSAALHDELVIY